MKKITLLFSAILIVSLSFYSCEQNQLDPSDPNATDFVEGKTLNKISNSEDIRYCYQEEVCLWAGQHIDAGNIIVGNDDTNLYVTVNSEEGFQNGEENIKIWVGTELPDKRPNAGHFPYKVTVASGETTATYQIPLSDIYDPEDECSPHQFYVLVHADVIADGGDETAWGGCDEGAGKSWWYSIDYTTQCCECWCGFGNDYQNPEEEACLSMMFEGNDYKFWSNSFDFDEMKDKEYTLSLLANPSMCEPQDKEGMMLDKLAIEVGKVVMKVYEGNGDGDNRMVDVKYILNDKYKGYNIQLDLYIGADRVPGYDLQSQLIKTDDTHMLFQHKLNPGEVTYTFMGLPWLTKDDSQVSYMSFHAAIGDCPMPSLQNPM
ncbi:MAG: hypothetical protein ABFR32_00615 [Bacteroidota bacterium]